MHDYSHEGEVAGFFAQIAIEPGDEGPENPVVVIQVCLDDQKQLQELLQALRAKDMEA